MADKKKGKTNYNPKSLLNLRPPWGKDNPPPPNRGRKKSQFKEYIKENKISYNDIQYLIKYILPMSKEELTELLKDDSKPFLVQVFARGLLQDYKSGNMNNSVKLLEKTFGK